jgi:hypothetical protein
MKNIESILFELNDHKSFDELNQEEKTLVLNQMSESAYNELYLSNLLAKSISLSADKYKINSNQKEKVMEHFKQKQSSIPIYQTPIALWKVAASFIVSMMGLYLYMNSLKTSNYSHSLATSDTIYIEKNIQGPQIFDTVYIYTKELVQNKLSKKTKNEFSTKSSQNEINPMPEYSGLHQLSVSEFNEPINNKKGNSIKEDSLISSIGFATL